MRTKSHGKSEAIDARFSRLFLNHYDEVLGFCVRRTNRSEAEDVAAEVYATAWRRIDDLEWDMARPWLFGIARGVLSNQRRSISRRLRLSQKVGSLAEPMVESPDVVDIRREQDQQVMDALAELREGDREMLMLAVWEELTAPEIAVVLDISISAAEQRLHRAKQRFSTILQPFPAQVSPRAAKKGGER